MEALLIGIGGAVGAVSRYLIGLLLGKTSFPWATLVVNALGSFILGLVLFAEGTSTLQLLVAVGFCGAFTTFSSFSFQTVRLWERDKQILAIVNAVGNIVISLSAFTVAWQFIL
ncbi:MAG: fluoride efflux transporter CrcB [Salinirussus sp.]